MINKINFVQEVGSRKRCLPYFGKLIAMSSFISQNTDYIAFFTDCSNRNFFFTGKSMSSYCKTLFRTFVSNYWPFSKNFT